MERSVQTDRADQGDGQRSSLHDLVADAIDGDQSAYRTLFERYKAYAWGVALRTTADRGVAEEAVVDGFASTFQSLHRIEDPARFQHYLASCVRHEVLAVVKRNAGRHTDQLDSVIDNDGQVDDAALDTPESAALGKADALQAFAALQRLDDRQQQAVYLVDVEEFSAAEAARTLGLSTNALHQLLFRARRSLRLLFIAPALDEDAPTSCRDCNDRLASFVRGSTSSADSRRVEAHLADCPACRTRLECATETNELISRAGAALPVGLGAAVATKMGAGALATQSTGGTHLPGAVTRHPVRSSLAAAGAGLVLVGVITAAAMAGSGSTSPKAGASARPVPVQVAGSRAAPSAAPAPHAGTSPAVVAPSTPTTASPTSSTSVATTTTTIPVQTTYAPPVLSSTMAPAGTSGYTATLTVGTAWSATLSAAASGATPAVSLRGQLPAGITFTGGIAGTFSGTPSTTGIYAVDIVASTPSGTTTAVVTLTVDAKPNLTSPAFVAATVGTPLDFAITASGFPVPAFSATGNLPPGLRFVPGVDGALSISGTPTANGSDQVTIQASNALGSSTQTLTVTVS